ncbi:MAG TPA: DNA-binding transcriptional regulator, partial [Lachnospiraceae bacterium]|nr:DNA-binding transcriptional regulator [Lachnospiraceae bacterium]
PLKNITSNYHYHTIEAENEETLDSIEAMLRAKNYLVET